MNDVSHELITLQGREKDKGGKGDEHHKKAKRKVCGPNNEEHVSKLLGASSHE